MANQQPDHATIAKFRRENFTAVGECFLQVLLLAKELKRLKLGTVSVDGTKVRALASKCRSVRYQRAGELVEQRAQEKARKEQVEHERTVAARQARGGAGRPPQPPSEEPAAQDQSNLTDPDSRLMKKNQRADFEQSYNAQATVDAEGSQLVVGQGVSQNCNEKNELAAGVAAIPEEPGVNVRVGSGRQAVRRSAGGWPAAAG